MHEVLLQLTMNVESRVESFARRLGWPAPILCRSPTNNEVYWFESGALDSALLVVCVEPLAYAVVYALEFGIFIPWHPLADASGSIAFSQEDDETIERFRYRNFATEDARKLFCERFRDCCGATWDNVQKLGPPHVYFERRSGGTDGKGD
jgi:hypothetical protein